MAVGKHRDVSDDEFDQDELEVGIKIEMEHTDDSSIAKEIAKDHLAEIPDYYTRLIKMEKEAGVDIESELEEHFLRNRIRKEIIEIIERM